MYNPVLHKDRVIGPVPATHTRSLPRPTTSSSTSSAAWSKSLTRPKYRNRSRSRSPGRPQLSLVICPDFQEYPEGMREYNSNANSPCPSPCRASSPMPGRTSSPMPGRPKTQFPFSGHLGAQVPMPHALARTRGTEVLRDTASLPCSPVFTRLGVGARFAPVTRELSLPSSPNLPRIHVQDFDPKNKVSEGNYHHGLNRKVVVCY